MLLVSRARRKRRVRSQIKINDHQNDDDMKVEPPAAHVIDRQISELPVFHDEQRRIKEILCQSSNAETNMKSIQCLSELNNMQHTVVQWQQHMTRYKNSIHFELLSKLNSQLSANHAALHSTQNQRTANNAVLSHTKLAAYSLRSRLGHHSHGDMEQRLSVLNEHIAAKQAFDKKCNRSINNIQRHLNTLKRNIKSMDDFVQHQAVQSFDARMESLRSQMVDREMEILKEWECWNCQQVVEWIKYIENGKFDDQQYERLFAALYAKRVSGHDLKQINELFLRDVVLYDLDRMILLDYIHLLVAKKNEVEAMEEDDEETKTSYRPNLCVICSECEVDTIGIPCMHVCLCWNCYTSKQHMINMVCPICSGKCQAFKKCYFQGF